MKLEIRVNDEEAKALAERVKRLRPKGPTLALDSITAAIQFLRGVNSRATLTLPAFYLFLGSNIDGANVCSVPGYPGVILKHSIQFSSINTITLSCRKAFDHANSRLTGAAFGKSTDQDLVKVAQYWAKSSGRPVEEAASALNLLRTVFRACSRPSSTLLQAGSTLGKRIGLLKQHADRSAAHLSLESYEFSIIDCAHVVAALTLVGEMIRAFDNAAAGTTYFDELDNASLLAARAMFPRLPDLRLFAHMKIGEQAQGYWRYDQNAGEHMLLEQLPYATGWF